MLMLVFDVGRYRRLFELVAKVDKQTGSLERQFDAALDNLGPFENKPCLAVAVSGGADSLALTFLAHGWVKKRSGSILGVTVDHALRADSAADAKSVGKILGHYGISHKICRYLGKTPSSRIQESARLFRYDLLGNLCREFGILHLLVAHHAADQRETVLMRRWRGSGLLGLAGMSAVREKTGYRILRPLLNIEPEWLKTFLKDIGITWIEDKSNENKVFMRVRARKYLQSHQSIQSTNLGVIRQHYETQLATWLATYARVSPAGYITFCYDAFSEASFTIRNQILARSIISVGGQNYAPRRHSLERIVKHLNLQPSSQTLGGCLIIRKNTLVYIFREFGRIHAVEQVSFGKMKLWDGRFRVGLTGSIQPGSLVAALGEEGWIQVNKGCPKLSKCPIPRLAGITLPALWDTERVVAVPHLRYNQLAESLFIAVFEPAQQLVPASFALVN